MRVVDFSRAGVLWTIAWYYDASELRWFTEGCVILQTRHVLIGAALAVLTACGGGGGGAPSGPTASPPPTVTGDMLAVAQNKGWNYQGSTPTSGPLTLTLYADPSSNGVTPLVLLAVAGTQSDATTGQKAAAITVSGSSGTYDVTSYTIYNGDGTIYANGGLPNGSVLVQSTLTQGHTFSPYAGMTATVTLVGSVPGAGACPTPGTGATVQYAFQGQTYSVSYVPGCGVTQYIGNHGETFTLTSVGTYQLGTLGDVRRMTHLTVFDSVKSLWHILMSGERRHNIL